MLQRFTVSGNRGKGRRAEIRPLSLTSYAIHLGFGGINFTTSIYGGRGGRRAFRLWVLARDEKGEGIDRGRFAEQMGGN